MSETDTDTKPDTNPEEPDVDKGDDSKKSKKGGFKAGSIDIKQLIEDPDVFAALIADERVVETVRKNIKKNVDKDTDDSKKETGKESDSDMEFIKKRYLSEAISNLPQEVLKDFILKASSLSLAKKIEWIDERMKTFNEDNKNDNPAKSTGLPAGNGSGNVGYFSEGYKHKFIDKRK